MAWKMEWSRRWNWRGRELAVGGLTLHMRTHASMPTQTHRLGGESRSLHQLGTVGISGRC